MRLMYFVYKWELGIKYGGDTVIIPNRNVYYPPSVMINYGKTKSPEKRKELLKRRKLAWERGLSPSSGVHYLEEEKRGFKQWDKEELKDIRKSEYWDYIKDYV